MKISVRLSKVLLFNVITATVSGKPFLDAQQQACAPRLQALDAVKLSNGVCKCLLISLLEGISKTLRETEVQVSASGVQRWHAYSLSLLCCLWPSMYCKILLKACLHR